MNTENETLMRQARESLKGNWLLAVGTFLVYLLIALIPSSIKYVGFIISLLISGPFALGLAIFSLSIARGQEAKMEQIFDGFKLFSKALLTYLLMVVIVLLWMLLLIIPGIIAGLSYSMTFYILADDNSLEPMAALDKSKQMMDGHKWKLFFLGLMFFGLALLCIFTLGIGFLWLLPFRH